MTLEEMVAILIDKGHSQPHAAEQAKKDYELMRTVSCSICRRDMTALEMRYHYHRCE
jgi:hypothetical protein